MNFKVGDLAVYPAQGIGMVQAIEAKSISGGKKESFYVLRILDTGVTIMIPMGNVEQVGLRRIMDSKSVRSIYKILQSRDVGVDPQPWNRRYRQYMDKLKSGSPFEIAEVLRNLLRLKGEKVLSFGERKMLDTARSLLVKEISIARSVTEEVVEADLRRFLEL
ncbi:MAG: CarD family transcriptional regulator [Thermodesulfobacteriota bacterium]|nr:CarD family transcriptional regulator [Thermodesulfobacteriota bacterium]